jgi:glycosyltransferase involved in cell wall biosynthesis
MRIGFDAKRAFHNATGLGNYSRDIIRLFSQNMPEAELFLFDPKGKSNINFEYNLSSTQIIGSSSSSSIGRSVWRQFGIAKEVKNLKLDVYHGLSNELPAGIQRTKAKSLVTIHDVIFDRHPEWYSFIDRNIYHQKVAKAIAHADVVIAISEQTKADLISIYKANPSKIEVVYQGCNPAFGKPQTPAEIEQNLAKFNLPEAFALYVGTIEPRKNLLQLVQAISHTDIPLVVVGRPTAYAKKVMHSLKGTELEKNFYHIRQVSTKQLASLYKKAKLFVYPSLYEGFGIPIIEALSSGTPVITGHGALAEACGGGGITVDVSDAKKLEEAVLLLWQDSNMRQKLTEAGKRHLLGFTDDEIWKRWQQIYNS